MRPRHRMRCNDALQSIYKSSLSAHSPLIACTPRSLALSPAILARSIVAFTATPRPRSTAATAPCCWHLPSHKMDLCLNGTSGTWHKAAGIAQHTQSTLGLLGPACACMLARELSRIAPPVKSQKTPTRIGNGKKRNGTTAPGIRSVAAICTGQPKSTTKKHEPVTTPCSRFPVHVRMVAGLYTAIHANRSAMQPWQGSSQLSKHTVCSTCAPYLGASRRQQIAWAASSDQVARPWQWDAHADRGA
jgi:hypothetical protein